MKIILLIFILISLITSLYIVKWKEVRKSIDRVIYQEYNITLDQYLYMDRALEKRLERAKHDVAFLYSVINDKILDNFIYLKFCIADVLFIHNGTMLAQIEKRHVGDFSDYDLAYLRPELMVLYDEFIHPNFYGTYQLTVQLMQTYIKGYTASTYILYAYYNDPIIAELLMSSVVGHMLFSWVKEWMFQVFAFLSFGALRFWQYEKIANVFLQLEFVGQVNGAMNWLIMMRVCWITLGLPDIFYLRGLYLLGIVTLFILYTSFTKMKSQMIYKIEVKADINVTIDNQPKSNNPSHFIVSFFTFIVNYQSIFIKLSESYSAFRPYQNLVAPTKSSYYRCIVGTIILVPIIAVVDLVCFVLMWILGGILLYSYMDNRKISPEVWAKIRNIAKDQFINIKGNTLDVSDGYWSNLFRFLAIKFGWTQLEAAPIKEKGFFDDFLDDMRTAYPDSTRARLARIYRVPAEAITGRETFFPTEWDKYVVFIQYLAERGETIDPADAVLAGYMGGKVKPEDRPDILKKLESLCIARYGIRYVDSGILVTKSDPQTSLKTHRVNRIVRVDPFNFTEEMQQRMRAIMRVTTQEYDAITYDLYENTKSYKDINLIETEDRTLYCKFLILRCILIEQGLDVHPEQFILPEETMDWQTPYECAMFNSQVQTAVMEAGAVMFGLSYYEEAFLIEDLRTPKSVRKRSSKPLDAGLWNAFQLLSDRVGEIKESDKFGDNFPNNLMDRLDNDEEEPEYVDLDEIDPKGKLPDRKTESPKRSQSYTDSLEEPLIALEPITPPEPADPPKKVFKVPEIVSLIKRIAPKPKPLAELNITRDDTFGFEMKEMFINPDQSDSSEDSVDNEGERSRKYRAEPKQETEDEKFANNVRNLTVVNMPRAKKEMMAYLDSEMYPLFTSTFSENTGHSEGNWITIGFLLEESSIPWPHPNPHKYDYILKLPTHMSLRYGIIVGSHALRPDLVRKFFIRIKRSPLNSEVLEDWLSHFSVIDYPRAIAWLIKSNYEYLQRYFSKLELQYYIERCGVIDHRAITTSIETGPQIFLTSQPGQFINPPEKIPRVDYTIQYINMETVDYQRKNIRMPRSKLAIVGTQKGYNLPVQVLTENKLMKQRIMTIDSSAQFIYTRVIPTVDLIVDSFAKYEKVKININMDYQVQGVTLRSWLISSMDQLINPYQRKEVHIRKIDEFNIDDLSADSRKAYPGYKCRNLGIKNKADQLNVTKEMAKRLRQDVLAGKKPAHLWSWMGIAKASKVGQPQIRGVLAGEMYFYINQYLIFDPFVQMMKNSRVSGDFKLFFGEFDNTVKKFPANDMKEILDLKDQGGRTQPIIGDFFFEWYSRLIKRPEDKQMLRYIIDTIFVGEFQIPQSYGGYVFKKTSGWSDGPYGTSAFDSFSMLVYYLTSIFFNAEREQISLNTIDLSSVRIETHADNWIHSYPIQNQKIFAWDQRVLTWYGQEVKGTIEKSVDITQLELMGFKIREHGGKYYGYRTYEKTIKSLVLNKKEYKNLDKQDAYELGILECLLLVDCWNDQSYSLLSRLHSQYRNNVIPEIVNLSYWHRIEISPKVRYARPREAWEPKPRGIDENIDELEVDHFSLYDFLIGAPPPQKTM